MKLLRENQKFKYLRNKNWPVCSGDEVTTQPE